MRNLPIAFIAVCLFTPPACLFTQAAVAKAEQEINRAAQPAPTERPRKTLAAKSGTLLNSDATPEEARKIAEATNRQILEKRRKR